MRIGMAQGQIAAYVGSLYGEYWKKEAAKYAEFYAKPKMEAGLTKFEVHVDAVKNEVTAKSVDTHANGKALFEFSLDSQGKSSQNVEELPYTVSEGAE